MLAWGDKSYDCYRRYRYTAIQNPSTQLSAWPKKHEEHATLQLARVHDLNGSAGLAAVRAEGLDGLDDFQSLGNLAKHNVLAIEPAANNGAAG
jgi:hypothetical protein